MAGTEPQDPQQQDPQQQEPNQSQQQQEPNQEPNQGQQATAIDYNKIAEILDGRQKATEDSVLKGYFKQQGITGDEAAQAIKAFKDAKAAKAPDVEGMSARIAELEQAAEAARVESAVTQAAVQMGIDAKAIPYLARMADLSDVGDGSGGIDTAKVSAALKKVLDDVPGLKPQPSGAGAGFSIGGAGGKDPDTGKAEGSALDRAFGLKRR